MKIGDKAKCRRIISETESVFSLAPGSIVSKRRTKDICTPRHIAVRLTNDHTAMNLSDIGRQFGGRDHTCVLNSLRRAETLLGGDVNLKAKFEAVRRALS